MMGRNEFTYGQAERLISAIERLARAFESFVQRSEPPPVPEKVEPVTLTSRVPNGEIEL